MTDVLKIKAAADAADVVLTKAVMSDTLDPVATTVMDMDALVTLILELKKKIEKIEGRLDAIGA